MKRLYLLLLSLSLLLVAFPITAQDSAQDEAEDAQDPQLELLDTVRASLEDMQALQAFRIDGNITVRQDVQTGGTRVTTTIRQGLDMNIAHNDTGVEKMRAELEQRINLGLGIGSGELRMELLLPAPDQPFYARLSDLTGLLLGLTGDDWVVLGSEANEAEFVNEAFPSTQDLITSLSRIIDYPITDETVLAVRERRGQTIRYERGQYESRRIEVEFNVPVLLELGVLDSALRPVDAPALGLTNAELVESLMQGASLIINFYIDEENGLFRRIETEYSYDTTFTAVGEEIRLIQTTEGRFTYTQFNQDFEVIAPEDFIE